MRTTHLLLASAYVTCAAAAALAEVPRPEPTAPKSAEKADRVTLGPNKDPGPAKPAMSEDGWIELATPTPAKHGTEFISVDPKAGAIATLRVHATKGHVVVDRIVVTFDDGTTKQIRQRRWLTPAKPTMLVELGTSKPIKKLVVTTDRHPPGTYAIFGAAAPGVATR